MGRRRGQAGVRGLSGQVGRWWGGGAGGGGCGCSLTHSLMKDPLVLPTSSNTTLPSLHSTCARHTHTGTDEARVSAT